MKILTMNILRPFLQCILALSLFLSMSAFRHTDVEGYTDPDFSGFQFRTVVLQMPNASIDFERRVVKYLTAKLEKNGVRVLLHDQLFAPTRQWDQESSAAIYERNDVDAGIIITLGSTGNDTTPGMVMYNTSTVGGFTTGYATQTSIARDHASFEIAIVDAESMRTAWIGNLNTRGAGLLFTGAKSTAKALVKGLMREWKTSGHLQKK